VTSVTEIQPVPAMDAHTRAVLVAVMGLLAVVALRRG
jgi:hypothetical protein